MAARQLRDIESARLPLGAQAIHQRFQHQLSGQTEHVTQYIADLHVGVFQHFLNTVALLGRNADHLLAPSRVVPQFSDRARRDEARTDHAMPQQMRQPACVMRIRLMPRNRLNLLWIRQNDFQRVLRVVFQHVEYWLPINARALHHDVGAAF